MDLKINVNEYTFKLTRRFTVGKVLSWGGTSL